MQTSQRLHVLPRTPFPLWVAQKCRRMIRHHERDPVEIMGPATHRSETGTRAEQGTAGYSADAQQEAGPDDG